MPSFYRVSPSDVETFTIVTNPIRTYSSSSTGGVTGSVHVFARRSHSMKDAAPDSAFVEPKHDDGDYLTGLRSAQQKGLSTRQGSTTGSFYSAMEQYLGSVNSTQQQRRLQQKIDVRRFTPSTVFSVNTLKKLLVKDTLASHYRCSYPTAHWAYPNYNTLNFFTASNHPTSSVMLYPNVDEERGGLTYHEGYISGTYVPSGSFSFDFYINPRYTSDAINGEFRAGTILHLSSTYALSLVSGSCKDENGRPVGFRLQLQLSCSADIPPSWVCPTSDGIVDVSGPSGSYDHSNAGALPKKDLIFLSDDNSLRHNHWHHVVVRWGTRDINGGSGSFNVDGQDRGTFCVPSSSITPSLVDIGVMQSHNPPGAQQLQPAVLCLGNFFEGPNHSDSPQAAFFAVDPATREGLQVLLPQSGIETPVSYSFQHPLNAEVHDVSIRMRYLTDVDLRFSASHGPAFLDKTFAFYVPPFFVESSPYRRFVNDHGGLMVTPFEEVDGASTRPFNVALSFGAAGHYINLENFTKDFASRRFPLLHHLTGVALSTSTPLSTCNQFLMLQPFVAKRNLTVLPCDDGAFTPNFRLLSSESLTRAVDDMGNEELGLVSLNDLVIAGRLLAGVTDDSSTTFLNLQLGFTPESPFSPAGEITSGFIRNVVSGSDVESTVPLTVYQRTQDPSSNQVTFFEISNIFYGMRIKPGSLMINDPDVVKSTFRACDIEVQDTTGPVSVTLADDGKGALYRADCITSQSTWNAVGNVYYDEGLVVVKSPHLYFFGHDSYALHLKGQQNVHVLKLEALAPNNQLNSSSNPQFMRVPPTGFFNEKDDAFVYITGINFHDTDLNVVMKSQLAQPIMKRHGNRILFKVKHDF